MEMSIKTAELAKWICFKKQPSQFIIELCGLANSITEKHELDAANYYQMLRYFIPCHSSHCTVPYVTQPVTVTKVERNQDKSDTGSDSGFEEGDSNESNSTVQHGPLKPWPKGIEYRNGSELTHECKIWLYNSCYRCGGDGHFATQCQLYPGKRYTTTLCSLCRTGFHPSKKCVNRFVNGQNSAVQTKVQSDIGNFGSNKVTEPGKSDKSDIFDKGSKKNVIEHVDGPPMVPVPNKKEIHPKGLKKLLQSAGTKGNPKKVLLEPENKKTKVVCHEPVLQVPTETVETVKAVKSAGLPVYRPLTKKEFLDENEAILRQFNKHQHLFIKRRSETPSVKIREIGSKTSNEQTLAICFLMLIAVAMVLDPIRGASTKVPKTEGGVVSLLPAVGFSTPSLELQKNCRSNRKIG